MTKAMVFNIQKFCIHDGPGIRTTVFFKGCPLRCSWCHNPESQKFEPELLVQQEKCTGCGQCQSRCLQGAAAGGDASGRCTACGICTDYCSGDARAVAGREYGLTELLTEIEKDTPFYEQSGGGVTLSGGEALCQIDFVERLVKDCSGRGIHVTIDTCGQLPYESFARVLDYTGLFLYDLKLADAERHRLHTGQDNFLILANLTRLRRAGAKVQLRLPLIEGINADNDNIRGVMAVAGPLGITGISLLPYHDIGRDKYKRLNREYLLPDAAAPTAGRLEEIRQMLSDNGFSVTTGG